MSKEYVAQLEATIENLRRDNSLLKEKLSKYKNVEPTNALECLDKMRYVAGLDIDSLCKKEFDTIKQALLKAQEPKQYLKWEDLEKDRTYKILLNGNQYELVKRYDDYEYHCDYITMQKKPNVSIFI